MATDADVQLSDMLESYPAATTPNFQTLISAKEEFKELASNPAEKLPPGRGQYFRHQKYTHRFLRAYDDLLVASETGSGKSCEILGFAEYTRKELEKAKVDPTTADEKSAHFKRVVVLVKGPTQRNEFKNQLTCKCSDGHYETPMVKRAKTETVQKSNLTLEIKKAGYIITTYTSFAHKIATAYPTEADNDRLAEDYSDTIFWIDEAHNLLIDPENTTAFKEKQQTYYTIWRVLHLARRSKRIISTATPMINDVKEIGSLMNLILPLDGILPPNYDYRNAPEHDIQTFFPGLPFDHRTASPEEIAPYFRGQFPPDYDFMTANLYDLEPYMRGRVSFIRAADTGAVIQEQGVTPAKEYEVNGVKYQSQLVLYAANMSEFQSNAYLNAKHGNQGRDELFGAERQASNFVFPDGYWGNGITEEERNIRKETKRAKVAAKAAAAAITAATTAGPVVAQPTLRVAPVPVGIIPGVVPVEPTYAEEGLQEAAGFEKRAFRRYVNLRGDTFTPTAEFLPWLQDLTYIRTLSCKFAEIVRIVMEDPGNAFVYGEYVAGSGAIVLALCLEGMGFERYNETTSMFFGIGGEAVKPVCGSGDKDTITRRVRPDILSRQQGAPLRYALLSRETSDSKFQSMMEAMNSYENRHGDYIKVLISSRVGRDGINVSNVLQIHLVGSEWNQSSIYQALSRGIRATSHDDLIQEEQARLIAEGGDPTTARVTVKIYKHAAIALDEAASSIDLEMYCTSEYKDRTTKRIMRIMKQCSIGCQVHYNRNVRATDVDGSPACDYETCRYLCVDPVPNTEDFSTYDVLYADEVVNDAVADIVNVYRQRNALTLDEISTLLPQYRRKYLIMGLERLINKKTPLIDRFGYTTYLREDNSSFYLDRTYPTDNKAAYAMSYYTQGVIGIEQRTLANVVVELETGEHMELLEELERMDPKDPSFMTRINNTSIEGQAAILEAAITKAALGQTSPFTDAILTKFQKMIFVIHDPVTELNKVYEQNAQLRPRKGRKRNPETKRRVKNINPTKIDQTRVVYDTDTEQVYLHILYSQVVDQTAYATTARFNKGEGRTRILKPSEFADGWRDLNEVELEVYNVFIQLENANRKQPFEDLGIYGFILPDGKFRIRDKLHEDPQAAADVRHVNRGKVCKTWYKPELIDIMYMIGVVEPQGIFPAYQEKDRAVIINWLIQNKINHTPDEMATWDFQQLMYYYKWHSAKKITRETLCSLIEETMRSKNMLLT